MDRIPVESDHWSLESLGIMDYAQGMARNTLCLLCVAVMLLGGGATCAHAQARGDDVIPNAKIRPLINPRGIIRNGERPAAFNDLFELKRILAAVIPTSVHVLVASLDDASYAVREQATADLQAHPSSDEVLLAVLEREPLTAEQRHRLLKALQWRIEDRPRGAVGIRMSPGRDGVLVTELISDLPAEKVLRVGDQILEINGKVVRENKDLVQVVQRLMPGTEIQMRVLRPRAEGLEPEHVNVVFSLGSYKKLGNEASVRGLTNPETVRRRNLMLAIVKRYRVEPEVVSTPLGSEAGVVKPHTRTKPK